MADYRMHDTCRPDGCYVTFERVEHRDNDATPDEYLFQDPEYREQDEARMTAWRNDEWHFIGVQAVARVEVVRGGLGVATSYTLYSPGLWAIESDSDEAYLAEVFAEECETLKGDMLTFGNPTYA